VRRRPRWLRMPGGAALGWILLGALVLRVWSLKHGLPYVYNTDEEQHFVPKAVQMVGGTLDPRYFENPPALTYLFYVVFKLRFHAGFPFGSHGFGHAFRLNPTAVFTTARFVVALLGTLSVGLVYWVGARFYERRVGLVAAVLMACAFLPVFYAKQALNDAVTLVPIAVALGASLFVYEDGRLRHWILAGAAVGVATDVKYTAAAMAAVVGLAGLLRVIEKRDSWKQFLKAGVVSTVAFGVLFVLLDPYMLVHLSLFKHQVAGEAGTAGGSAKLGQSSEPGWVYYIWTLSWGFGWLPTLASVAGAGLALRSNRARGLLLVLFPLLLLVFLGGQARHFGRWFLPAYPALAVLAAYAAVRTVDALPASWSRHKGKLVGVAAALLAIQGLWSSVRVNSVFAKTDTRTLARQWIERSVPAGSGLVVEPAVFPKDFLTVGKPVKPYRLYPIKPPFQGYEKNLTPALIDSYRAGGYCSVLVASYQRDRGASAKLTNASAYYSALAAASAPPVTFSPYRFGAKPVKFNFDLSYDFLPRAYLRPGPLLQLYHLKGCSTGV
jgi:4-amino-4-deoxy-L-arabinose transferase-like glycosyltransferase